MTKRTAVLRAGLNEAWDFQSLGFSVLAGSSGYELFYPSHEGVPLKRISLLLLTQYQIESLSFVHCTASGEVVPLRPRVFAQLGAAALQVPRSSSQPGREEGRANFIKCFNRMILSALRTKPA